MVTFRHFLLESKAYHKQPGESHILHHVGDHDIKEFHPLSHFGTHQAARDRIMNKAHPDQTGETSFTHYAVRIMPGKVAHIEDNGFETHQDLVDSLHQARILDHKEKEHFYAHEDSKDLALHLRKKGIHTLAYKNTSEHVGSTSYMITHPSQVRVLRQKRNPHINWKRDSSKYD